MTEQAKIDFEKAEALFVKTNEILGDVFTNREAYKQLDNYILDRALTNLGIDNMIAGLSKISGCFPMLKE